MSTYSPRSIRPRRKSLTLAALVLCSLLSCTQSIPINCNVSSIGEEGPGEKELHLLVSAPYPDPLDGGWDGGIALIPAVRLALNQINNCSNILPGYKLVAVEDDSGCQIKTKAAISFTRNVYYGDNNIVGIIGPGCSAPTLLMAPLLSRPEVSLIQIAPTATSPRIETRNESTTFTMRAPLGMVNNTIELMRKNNWTNFATLYDAERDIFSTLHFATFNETMHYRDLKIRESAHVLDENVRYFPLDKIIESRARVVAIFMEPPTALRVMCVAYHKRMIYPTYQWVMVAKSLNEFSQAIEPFTVDRILYNCSKQMMAKALNGSIITQFKLDRDDDTLISPLSISYEDYRDLYSDEFLKHLDEERVQNFVNASGDDKNSFIRMDYWENLYYDAAWAFALAIDGAIKNGLSNITHYRYGQPDVTQHLINELSKVRFEGASGPIRFTPSRNVKAPIVTSQLMNNGSGLSETALYVTVNGTLQVINFTNFHRISDSFNEVPERVHISLGIIVMIITIIIAIITVILHMGFILWSDAKSVKATSPNISQLIFSGCYLFSIAALFFTIQQMMKFDSIELEVFYSVLCNTITWCLLLGFSLIFGTVFVKVWRVFKLFRHFRNNRPGRLLSDKALILDVLCLVFIDCVLCIIWNAYDPWILNVTPVQDLSFSIEEGNTDVLVSLSCTCEYMYWWIGVTVALKGLIALLLVVFATLNRKINRKHFSHTKKVNVLVYTLTMLCGVGFPLYFVLTSANVSIYASFLTFCLILLVTIVMCCVMLFVPPLWPAIVHRNLRTEKVTFRPPEQPNPRLLPSPQTQQQFI